MKMFIGLTDYNWYSILKSKKLDEVNFWKPGKKSFIALEPNDLFLFKLKSPYNVIVGGAFFVKYSSIPISMTWDTFGEKNGTIDFQEFLQRIKKYRLKNGIDVNYPFVGCIVLTEPFFFNENEWIVPPSDMAANVVTGKVYGIDSGEGHRVFVDIMSRISNSALIPDTVSSEQRYSQSMVKHRLGQGGFKIVVTDAYNRRCAISGEKTLPVLQAAHIKPYSQDGPHSVENGILLRSDIHRLFDDGYITITPDLRIFVSERLQNDYGNGKIYYQYNQKQLENRPKHDIDLPSKDFLEWHNDTVYLR